MNFTSIKKVKISEKEVELGNPDLGMMMAPVRRALEKRSGRGSGGVSGTRTGSPGLAREVGESLRFRAPGAGEWGINRTQVASSAQPGRTVKEREAVEKVTWLNYPTYIYRAPVVRQAPCWLWGFQCFLRKWF